MKGPRMGQGEVRGETWGGGELERGGIFLPLREVISPRRGPVVSSEAYGVLRQRTPPGRRGRDRIKEEAQTCGGEGNLGPARFLLSVKGLGRE